MPRKKKPEKLPPNVRRHGKKFRAVLSVDGERQRSPVLPTVAAVQEWIQQFRDVDRGPDDLVNLTLRRGLELIEEDLRATEARKDTFSFYRRHGNRLFTGLGGDDQLVASITSGRLRAYIAQRRAEGVSAGTIVGKELFILKRIRKLALQEGYILPIDPFARLRLPKSRTGRFGVLTRERIGEILTKMRAAGRKAPWHADLVETLFCTGLRRAELARLRVKDIDFAARRIFVDGKTGHRYQPFGKDLDPVLARLVAAAQPDGRLITSVHTLEKVFERWAVKANEPRFSPHVMRHSYGTEMAALVGPFDLMALMGHKSLTQTSRYFHGRDAGVRAALDGLRPDPPAAGPAAP